MKPYTSKAFLWKRYVQQRRTIDQIAEECGVSKNTIQNWLEKFELIRNPRTLKR